MGNVLVVGLGGFLGSALRYTLARLLYARAPGFPLGTLAVNVLGCLAIGLLEADTPFWLITLVVIGYGSVVISWNGTSQAEFAHLSPPGETAKPAFRAGRSSALPSRAK